MDSESLGVLQRAAAEAEGLPLNLSGRLRGSSYGELCQDAKQALKDFGFTPPPARTPDGRFASMSDMIRHQAGYPVATEPEQPEGDLGIGRGGSALPRQSRPPDMNSLIRAACGAETTVIRDLAAQMATEEAGYG